jgi:hypothetical protein
MTRGSKLIEPCDGHGRRFVPHIFYLDSWGRDKVSEHGLIHNEKHSKVAKLKTYMKIHNGLTSKVR